LDIVCSLSDLATFQAQIFNKQNERHLNKSPSSLGHSDQAPSQSFSTRLARLNEVIHYSVYNCCARRSDQLATRRATVATGLAGNDPNLLPLSSTSGTSHTRDRKTLDSGVRSGQSNRLLLLLLLPLRLNFHVEAALKIIRQRRRSHDDCLVL